MLRILDLNVNAYLLVNQTASHDTPQWSHRFNMQMQTAVYQLTDFFKVVGGPQVQFVLHKQNEAIIYNILYKSS